MVKNLIDILGKHKDAIFLVFTNGLLLDREKIKDIKKQNHIIPILSFEGNNYHNKRRRGVGKELEDVLRNLMESNISSIFIVFNYGSFFHDNLDMLYKNLKPILLSEIEY